MSDVKTIEQAPIEQTPQPIPEVVQKQYDHLVETIRAYNPGADFAQIDAAFRYAAAHHGAQKRKDGSPFVTHPIAVAQIVAEELHLDSESIIAALLHDCIEDTDATYDDIAKRFSPTVADLVEGVSKLTRVHYTSKEEEQMENLRKMLMAMAKDIRVILIKIADRTHNMRTMEYQSTDKQRQKSLETMEIYAPIAHRLGMQRMKWELEDLSLKYLDPTAFNEITHSLEEKSKEYGSFMERIQKQIGFGCGMGASLAFPWKVRRYSTASGKDFPQNCWRKVMASPPVFWEYRNQVRRSLIRRLSISVVVWKRPTRFT